MRTNLASASTCPSPTIALFGDITCRLAHDSREGGKWTGGQFFDLDVDRSNCDFATKMCKTFTSDPVRWCWPVPCPTPRSPVFQLSSFPVGTQNQATVPVKLVV
jgi:hypothetical protein